MLSCSRQNGCLVLQGELQISFLETLQDCLDSALHQSLPLEIDVSGVSEVDIPGLQLLLAFLLSRGEEGPVTLINPSQVLLKGLELSGLDEHFTPFMA